MIQTPDAAKDEDDAVEDMIDVWKESFRDEVVWPAMADFRPSAKASSMAARQKNPGSARRLSSPQTIISLLYFSLYSEESSNLWKSSPRSSAKRLFNGALKRIKVAAEEEEGGEEEDVVGSLKSEEKWRMSASATKSFPLFLLPERRMTRRGEKAEEKDASIEEAVENEEEEEEEKEEETVTPLMAKRAHEDSELQSCII